MSDPAASAIKNSAGVKGTKGFLVAAKEAVDFADCAAATPKNPPEALNDGSDISPSMGKKVLPYHIKNHHKFSYLNSQSTIISVKHASIFISWSATKADWY